MQIKILKLLKTAKNSSGIHCHVLARNHGINLYLSNKSLSVTKYSRWSGLDLGDRKELEWRDVLTEAEQIVGYPTSFLNLRWLFNDEIANTAIHLRKLVGSNHPLLKSAKNLLIGSKSNLQSVGLIILLISKAAGFNNLEFTRDQYDSCVLHSQRALAEIVEMKRTGHIIHKTMVNLREKEKHGEKYKDLLYGNKIVLLTGSNEMRSHYEWEKEDNLRKLGSNEYLGQGKDEWIYRTMLMSGSILGKGCQGAMKLANRGEQTERDAYILGGHLALIWQLYLDVKEFFTHPYLYSLVGAPVTFALWEYPTIYSHILEAKLDKKPVEYKQLYYAVRGTRAIDYLSNFLDDELAAVLKYSERFPVTDARLSLQKMALTIHGEAVQYIEM